MWGEKTTHIIVINWVADVKQYTACLTNMEEQGNWNSRNSSLKN